MYPKFNSFANAFARVDFPQAECPSMVIIIFFKGDYFILLVFLFDLILSYLSSFLFKKANSAFLLKRSGLGYEVIFHHTNLIFTIYIFPKKRLTR